LLLGDPIPSRSQPPRPKFYVADWLPALVNGGRRNTGERSRFPPPRAVRSARRRRTSGRREQGEGRLGLFELGGYSLAGVGQIK